MDVGYGLKLCLLFLGSCAYRCSGSVRCSHLHGQTDELLCPFGSFPVSLLPLVFGFDFCVCAGVDSVLSISLRYSDVKDVGYVIVSSPLSWWVESSTHCPSEL